MQVIGLPRSRYFRFLSPYIPDIEYGRVPQVVDLLHDHLVDFVGTHTFEELCREWVWHTHYALFTRSELGPEVAEFAKQNQISVITVNQIEQDIIRWMDNASS